MGRGDTGRGESVRVGEFEAVGLVWIGMWDRHVWAVEMEEGRDDVVVEWKLFVAVFYSGIQV